jgi:hypothetical protein
METLAVSAISLLAPYLSKGAESFAKAAGNEAFEGVKALASRLQKWWSGDPVATAAVANLSKDPQRYGKLLSELLATDLSTDGSFAVELRKLVEDLAPSVDVIQKMEIARGVTGAEIGSLVRGAVRVEQQIKDGTNVTAVRVDKIGGN